MQIEQLRALVADALEDLKAKDIKYIDVSGLSSVMDMMVIASGTSRRHVAALAENVVTKAKEHGVQPLGVEGQSESNWVLVDLGDLLVHVMMPDTRALYDLEKLWQVRPADLDNESAG